jgi:hypothetical protein
MKGAPRRRRRQNEAAGDFSPAAISRQSLTGFDLKARSVTDGDDEQINGVTGEIKQMTTKQRLRKLRTECPDWNQIIEKFEMFGGMSRRDAELGILGLVDVGLVRIEPNANGPTAFVLTIPEGIPDEVLSHVA